jgi:hypothetical protein
MTADTPPAAPHRARLTGAAEVLELLHTLGAQWQELAMFAACDTPAAVIRLHSPGQLEQWLDAHQIQPSIVSNGSTSRMHARIGDVLVTWPVPAPFPMELG